MFLSIALFLIISVLCISYFVGNSHETYWKKRGVPYDNSTNFLATVWRLLMSKRPLYEVFTEIYNKYPDVPAVGLSAVVGPTLFVRDPVNMQYVLSENFQAFYHRGVEINKEDLLADNVLFMNGARWKLTREKMTPLFTSAKLKNMHYIMDKSAMDFVEYLKDKSGGENDNAFENMTLFCCASIGAAVFGVGTGSTFKCPFLDIARKAFQPTLASNIKFALIGILPKLFKILGLKLFHEHEEQFIGAIKRVLRDRESENVKKHDFADLALSIQRSGMMKDETTGFELDPTDELMAAQGFFFLTAGVDPSATGMFFTLFEVAKRPKIQKRVQDEIDNAFTVNNGKIDFEIVSNMEYLDSLIKEALRMHPPISILFRKCTEDTILPVGNIKVDKGTVVNLPILPIHHDPKYYPNPEDFDPERFSKENKRERTNMSYIPFGAGNRICIGNRFAYLQMKTGLMYLLRNFSVKTNDGDKKVEYLKTPLLVRPKNVNFYFVSR